jgi:hypothetical protein
MLVRALHDPRDIFLEQVPLLYERARRGGDARDVPIAAVITLLD